MRVGYNRRYLAAFFGSVGALALATASHAAVYAGNGATGFGGPLGNGNLTITNDPTGTNITFTLNNAGGFSGNDVVVYLDTTPGGYADTSSFTDNQDGGREAVSAFNGGNPSRDLITFAPGFGADFALEFENDTYDGLFNLANPANFGYVTGNGPSTPGGPYVVTIPVASLGLTAGQSFTFEADLISTSAYGSNETIGSSVTIPDTGSAPNAGFNGQTIFTTDNSYTVAVPEPTSLATLGLAGLMLRRRKRTQII